MVFDYGGPFIKIFEKENEVWEFIDKILIACLFMESEGFHYPLLSRRYLITTFTEEIKLINPFCFADFL